ncbi:hypothetical protein BDW62DRAFT_198045 [Aspergillus aurantiobrunneus]
MASFELQNLSPLMDPAGQPTGEPRRDRTDMSEPPAASFQEAKESANTAFGYPEFSKFLATEKNFPIFRRFDRIALRVLLMLQDHVSQTEERLDKLDEKAARLGPGRKNNGSIRNDPDKERKELLGRAFGNLERYCLEILPYLAHPREYANEADSDRFLSQYMPLVSLASPPNTDLQSFEHDPNHRPEVIEWPIDEKELGFVMVSDLIPLVRDSTSPSRLRLDEWEAFRTWKCFRKDIPDPLKPKYSSGNLIVTDESKITLFEKAVSGSVGFLVLFTPLWILAIIRGSEVPKKLAVIMCFACLLCFVVWAGTTARTFEALAVVAGYTAVLMVLLQVKD